MRMTVGAPAVSAASKMSAKVSAHYLIRAFSCHDDRHLVEDVAVFEARPSTVWLKEGHLIPVLSVR
jgi:hypothetical protein